jgi:hypothetical protein
MTVKPEQEPEQANWTDKNGDFAGLALRSTLGVGSARRRNLLARELLVVSEYSQGVSTCSPTAPKSRNKNLRGQTTVQPEQEPEQVMEG